MKKRVFGMKLSRGGGARMALRRALIRSLVLNGKIITTKAKVKFVQRDVEKLVSDSIKADMAKRRKVYAFLANNKEISNLLFELANKFGSRSSGFTRMTILPRRRGDNAQMARLEWTEDVSVGIGKVIEKPAKKAKKSQVKKEKTEPKKSAKKVKKADK